MLDTMKFWNWVASCSALYIYIYIYIYIYAVYNTWGGCACRNFLLGCPDNVWGDELSVYSIHKRGDT